MGGGKGGSKSQTVTQSTDPWSGQQPYLTQQFAQAQDLYNSGQLAPAYYPGQTVASQSPDTLQAIQAAANQSTSPQAQGLNSAANQQITDTLNGNYLNPENNPGFQQSLDDAQKAYSTGTAAQTDASFARDGAYGGSAYDETKQMQNKAYGDSLNTLAGNLYTQGRTNQLQAAAIAPQTQAMPYTDISQLANAGATQDAYNQSQINAGVNEYNYNQNLPYNSLANYLGLTSGNYGGSSTQTSPYYGNSTLSGIGTGLQAAGSAVSLYNALPTFSSIAALFA